MNFRRGFQEIVPTLIIIGGIPGMIIGVGLVLHLHTATQLHQQQALAAVPTIDFQPEPQIDFQPEPNLQTTKSGEKPVLDFQPEQARPEPKIEITPKARLAELCIAAGFGGAVAGYFLILCAFLTCRVVCSTVYSAIRKPVSYTTDALRLGGKQMLCDIIKWTVIIIIAAIVFLIVHHTLYPYGY